MSSTINLSNDFIDINDIISIVDTEYKNKNKLFNNNELICPNCNSTDYYTNGINCTVECKKCNNIISYMIDYKSHGIYDFDSNETNNYGCSFVNIDLPQTSSIISMKGYSIDKKVKLLHSWNIIPQKERNLNNVYSLIQNVCNKYNIVKNIEDSAKIMYKQIYDNKSLTEKNVIIRGTNYKSFIVSCFSRACKLYNENLSKTELANMFGIHSTDVKKGEKIFNNLVKVKKFNIKDSIILPEHYIVRFCNKLNLAKCLIDQAYQIVLNIQKLHIINEHKPNSVAVCAIYAMIILNNLNIQKTYISKILIISQATIVKTFKKIEDFKDILLNNELCDLINIRVKEYQNKIIYNNKYVMNCIKFNVDCSIKQNNINDMYYQSISENIALNMKNTMIDNIIIKNLLNSS
jgi:transcription initiation factor TFIIB